MIFPHYFFYCTHCGSPMPLHAERLEIPFQNLNPRPTHFPPVVVLCRTCNHAEMYTTDPQSPYRGRREPQVMACQTEDSYYDGLLQCEVASCKSLVRIFAQWNDAITGKERNANLEQMI